MPSVASAAVEILLIKQVWAQKLLCPERAPGAGWWGCRSGREGAGFGDRGPDPVSTAASFTALGRFWSLTESGFPVRAVKGVKPISKAAVSLEWLRAEGT